MKKITTIITQFVCLFGLVTTAVADNIPADRSSLTLVNHYSTDLHFRVSNQFDAPNFPAQFTLKKGESITSRIIYINGNNDADPCNSGNSISNSYIKIQAVPALPQQTAYSAFLGTGLSCHDRGLVEVNGMVNNHIAYSFSIVPQKHNTVIFCTPEEYNNGCV